MKHIEAFIAGVVWMVSVASPAWGQWTGGPTGPIYYNGGNVGIGTANPSQKVDVVGNIRQSTGGDADILSVNGNGKTWEILNLAANNHLWFWSDAAGGVVVLNLSPNGNVGIGTTNPQYLLSVEGTIGAKEVIVTNTGWSDYVFDRGYRLRPLSEVKTYIQANHHLPDIPSEAEVKAAGVSVGDMQSKLLAKIEELTLHMIAAEEQSERLRKAAEDLQRENRQIREQMVRLAAREGNLIR